MRGKTLELPGGFKADLSEPSQDAQLILNALNQVVIGLNNLNGQIDMLIRIQCGAVTKADVMRRYKAHDEAVKQAMADQMMDKAEAADQ